MILIDIPETSIGSSNSTNIRASYNDMVINLYKGTQLTYCPFSSQLALYTTPNDPLPATKSVL